MCFWNFRTIERVAPSQLMDFINKKHCPLLLTVRFLDIDCNGDVACTASAGAQFSQFFEFFEFVKSVSVLTAVLTAAPSFKCVKWVKSRSSGSHLHRGNCHIWDRKTWRLPLIFNLSMQRNNPTLPTSFLSVKVLPPPCAVRVATHVCTLFGAAICLSIISSYIFCPSDYQYTNIPFHLSVHPSIHPSTSI